MMNKKIWVENRIKELTEQRRKQLEEVYEEQWLFRVGAEEEERVSLEYSEEIIPDAIEKLKYEDGLDEAYTSALEEINFNYSIWNLQKKWDEIEEKFPRYIEEIKSFFAPFIDEYNELEDVKREYINSSVERDLEIEKDEIAEQAEDEYPLYESYYKQLEGLLDEETGEEGSDAD